MVAGILCVSAIIFCIGGGGILSGADQEPTQVGTFSDETSMLDYTLYSDNTAIVKSAKYAEGKVTIPSTVTKDGVDYTVTQIDGQSFSNNQNVTSVTIAKSVESINSVAGMLASHYGAFMGCIKLETVVFEEGSNLVYIGQNAFSGCIALSSINLPEGLKEIDNSAFGGKTTNMWGVGQLYYYPYSIEEITIPASVEKLGTQVFA
ncbi:MAG: leucine-rich repeat domain-containing protein, partial [Candidatus Methanomethylophilaceae archaeon]|nr:leucine-rich repeat domain-containing protein [Candidatus Methanomethylophilaceae archaeon]